MGKYDALSKEQLIQLLEKRDRSKKLGLVWERDEIEIDHAIDENFIVASLNAAQSEKASPWRNMVIEGDNFDALRWLRMTHSNRIKCIYIDPPYNTGNKDWVYNDHYFDAQDRYKHSTWLEFLYRRLILARDLLTDDGVLLISINDDNRALLEMLANEALPGMRIGSLVWRCRTGGNEGGDAFISINQEHILAYGNPSFRFGGTEKTFEKYSNPDNDPRGDWRDDNLTVSVAYSDKRAGNAFYPLLDPKTGIYYPPNPDRVWVYASRLFSRNDVRIKTRYMEDWIASGQILFPEEQRVVVWETKEALLESIRSGNVPKSGNSPMLREDLPDLDSWVGRKVGFGTPRFKRFKKDLRNTNQPLSSWITPRAEIDTVIEGENIIISGTNDEGAKSIKAIFGEKAFNYAKPVSLIKELIRQASSPGDIILDFFAGSATTAQAIMELNAEDEGERSFIMVSSTEATAEEPDKNICQSITAERIRKLNTSTDKKFENISAEFAYLTLRDIPFEDLNYELKGEEIWVALQAIHGLALTAYIIDKPFQLRSEGHLCIVYVDSVDDSVLSCLKELLTEYNNVFIYSWAPGQLTEHLQGKNVEILPVRDSLVQRFQQ